jgi:glycosyltransferase involved in cell wall biosynthesis
MRVAFVVPSLGLREGQGNVNLELLRRVAAAGHEVDVFTSLWPPEAGEIERVRLRKLARLPAWQLGNQFMMLGATTRRLRSGRYDLVHADAGMTMRRADVIVAHTISDKWYELPREVWREHGLRGANQAVATRFKARLELKQYREARAVVAATRATAQDLIARGVQPEHIDVIPFGVDGVRFRPPTVEQRAQARAAFSLRPDDFVVLFVGAHGPRKGLEIALESLAVAAPGEALLVAGELRGGEYAEVAERRLLPVRMPGKLDDVVPAYWAADALAYPTRYDQFGMAVLEAMSCGLPVIVAKEAGSHEIVRDAGFVLAEHNADALRAAIDVLRFDPERRARMGRRAREIAQEKTWDKAGAMLANLYARLREGSVQSETSTA